MRQLLVACLHECVVIQPRDHSVGCSFGFHISTRPPTSRSGSDPETQRLVPTNSNR